MGTRGMFNESILPTPNAKFSHLVGSGLDFFSIFFFIIGTYGQGIRLHQYPITYISNYIPL